MCVAVRCVRDHSDVDRALSDRAGRTYILIVIEVEVENGAELLLHRSCMKYRTWHTLHVRIACTAEQAFAPHL